MPDLPVRQPFRWALVAQTDEEDVQNRVSNVAVVSWLMRAAVEHSASLGWDHDRYVQLGGFFVVRRHEIDYLSSSSAGDQVSVFTWPSGIERATAERSYVVLRDSDQTVVARARTVWGFVDATTGRPKRIPPELAETFDPAKFA